MSPSDHPPRRRRRGADPKPGAPADAGPFQDVLRAAQAGGERALASLYRAHDPALRRYLRAQVGQEADDIASQAWLDIARNLGAFRGDEDAFRGWAFTIARRRLIDARRRRARRPEDAVDRAVLERVHQPADPADIAADAISGDAAARRIAELLPPDQAEIVLLRVVADLDVATVARITGKRPGAVRVAQHRALKRLARALHDATPGEDPGDVV